MGYSTAVLPAGTEDLSLTLQVQLMDGAAAPATPFPDVLFGPEILSMRPETEAVYWQTLGQLGTRMLVEAVPVGVEPSELADDERSYALLGGSVAIPAEYRVALQRTAGETYIAGHAWHRTGGEGYAATKINNGLTFWYSVSPRALLEGAQAYFRSATRIDGPPGPDMVDFFAPGKKGRLHIVDPLLQAPFWLFIHDEVELSPPLTSMPTRQEDT